jgi:hypothetical protein
MCAAGQGGAAVRRTAIVVCAGVGDNANGQAAARTMNGLVKGELFVSASQRIESFPSAGEDPQELHRYTLTAADGSTVELYEFWWADLSRFPAAMRSYLVTLYGLVLQLPAIGIAALRGGAPLTTDPATDAPLPACAWPLAWIEWLLAVPLLLVSALEAFLIGGFALVAWTNGQTSAVPEVARVAILVIYGLLVLGLGWWWLRRYRRDRGRYLAVPVGAGLFVAAAVVIVWRGGADHSLLAGLADGLLVLVAYVVRPIWIAVGGSMAALLIGLVISGTWLRKRDATITALAAVATATAGFAILTGALLAAAGAAVRDLAPAWESPTRVPWCLGRAYAWVPSRAHCPPSARSDPWHWGLDLYTLLLSPLAWVALTAGIVVIYAGLVAARPAAGIVRRNPGIAGRGVTDMIRRLDARLTECVLSVALLAAAGMIVIVWIPVLKSIPRADGGANGITPPVAAITGAFILGGLAVTRALSFTVTAVRENSDGNDRTRLILDKAYDVATFLREPGRATRSVPKPPPCARQQILSRYEALLHHVLRPPPVGRGYTHIVFFAHSQGSVLTATVLTERLRSDLHVDLITFGCPLDQLYARRFPAQFGWVERLPTDPNEFVCGVTGTWVNFVGAADIVGGTLFHDRPHGNWAAADPTPWCDRIGALRVADIPVAGGHGSYWTNPTVFQHLAEVADGRARRPVEPP